MTLNKNTLEICHRPAANVKWPSRTYCCSLENMRKILKTLLEKNKRGNEFETGPLLTLMSLVEEVQVYGSRMEAALEDLEAFDNLKEKYKKLEKQVEELEKKKSELTE